MPASLRLHIVLPKDVAQEFFAALHAAHRTGKGEISKAATEAIAMWIAHIQKSNSLAPQFGQAQPMAQGDGEGGRNA